MEIPTPTLEELNHYRAQFLAMGVVGKLLTTPILGISQFELLKINFL